jgi:hypothetical protein
MADKDRTDLDKDERQHAPGSTSEAEGEESAEVRARREARRRVLMGGLASAPVILTLGSRPASAWGWGGGGGNNDGGKCGYSGMMSGNASQAHADTASCKGKMTKYWKTKGDDCKKHFVTGPCNPIYMDYHDRDDYSIPKKRDLKDYRKKVERDEWGWSKWEKLQKIDEYLYWLDRYPGLDSPPFGTKFTEVFGSGIADDHKLTVMQALWLDEESPQPPSGNEGPTPLLAHCAAAFCNACEYGESSFGMSTRDLVDMVRSEIYSNPFQLEDMLRLMNDQG